MDLFIIGRNFDRNTTVLFREYNDGEFFNYLPICFHILEGTIGWSSEAVINKPYFHQVIIV
jgi:hypothetical protein